MEIRRQRRNTITLWQNGARMIIWELIELKRKTWGVGVEHQNYSEILDF